MKILKMLSLTALVSLKLSAGENDVSSQIQVSGDEVRSVQSQLQHDWSEAENHLLFSATPTCQSFFSYCASVHGPTLFEWIEGKSIAILTQAVSSSLYKDYLFTFMRNMKQNLFSLYETPSLEASKRPLRSYVYASFPQKWLRTRFHSGFNFVQHEPMLRDFFENNRQGTSKTQMRELLLDHLLTTRSGAQSLSLFFESLEFSQKDCFLKSSLFNAKRLRGFKDNTCILSDFPELQAHVIQHNAWLDLTSKMDKWELISYVHHLGGQEKTQKIFAARMILQDRAGMFFDIFEYMAAVLQLIDADQHRELLLSIAKDSTRDIHQQAYAMKFCIQDAENHEILTDICESILQDPKEDLTRQLYAVQGLVGLDPVAQALFMLQELSTEIWKCQDETTPIQIKARIHAAAKKAFSSFQKADVEALRLALKEDPKENNYTDRIEYILLELNMFSQKERAETAKRFELRIRLALKAPKPLEELMKWRRSERGTWKLRVARESFPFDPLGAEALLLDIVRQSKGERSDSHDSSYSQYAARLLKMFNRPEALRKAYTFIMNNSQEHLNDRKHAKTWLEVEEEVALITASGSLEEKLSLEFSYLLGSFQSSRNEENLWAKILLHTHSQSQKQTAINKLEVLRAEKLRCLKEDSVPEIWFLEDQD